jgi:tRNA pseudouridine32 synthase/23S rRNA pseudouridine746 synthase/23S rRNA pseudouridine1911/1915/1917 synthase
MHDKPKVRSRHAPKGVEILHDDRDIIVVDKAPGLLTIGTDREKSRTAYFALTDYVRKGNSKSRKHVFIVHRLDREVSGVLVFAKSPEAKEYLQTHWDEAEKIYFAVVHGHIAHKAGTLTSYLTENTSHVVHATTNRRVGKLSTTQYTVLKETKEFSLLQVRLLTGRKHQIRVHLADAGIPIVGDKKYGKGNDRQYRRIALHALSLTFPHPFSRERVTFTTEVPSYFKKLVGEVPGE